MGNHRCCAVDGQPAVQRHPFFQHLGTIISALLLGLANAVLRPLLVILTLPLTLLSFGFFLLVINALMLLLVAKLVSGFKISGFWTAFFASLFISILSIALGSLAPNAETTIYRLPQPSPQAIAI